MSNIIIYSDGLFASNDSHLQDLMNSGVSTIILWSLHVHPNADLYYNKNVIVSNGKLNLGPGPGQINPNMKADLQKLRSGGVSLILFSIGAGGPPPPEDYHNIQQLLSTPSGNYALTTNFKVLAKELALDGFDYDCEEDGISVNTITTLTQILAPLGKRNVITFCPYLGDPTETFWLQCMSAIYKSLKQVQPVRWWNLQNYGGADPASWIQEMKLYIKTNPIGVLNANAFMYPGLAAYQDNPSNTQSTFAGWQGNGLNLQGGFIWNLSSIYNDAHSTPKAYAQAIAAGLARREEQAEG